MCLGKLLMSFVLPPPPPLRADASLFIDFDGTLVELIDRPDEIVVDEGLRDLLGRVGAALPGRVAIVSGRSIAQIDHFLGIQAKSFAVAGSHGVERRRGDGVVTLPDYPPSLDAALAAFSDFASAHPGTIVEPKSFGVTLHYRLAPELEGKAREFVQHLAETYGFDLQAGKMMVELKIAGGNKGQAVAAFMKNEEMVGTHPWFVGDDLTDEAGFAAAHALGGDGILVGPPRETAATYNLADVASVRSWLAGAIGPA